MKAFGLIIGLVFSLAVSAQPVMSPLPAESKVSFTIANFGIDTDGSIGGIRGEIKFDDRKPIASSFYISLAANTVNTGNERRDNHLKKEEFFDVDKYPSISLKSTSIKAATVAGQYIFTGDLTLKNITKSISFLFSVVKKDSGYLFTGKTQIDRREFGVGGNSATMSDKVSINISVLAK